MKKILDDLCNKMKDDYLLVRLLVYLSSENDVKTLLNYAPLHVVVIHLSKICQKYERLNREKVRSYVSRYVIKNFINICIIC